MNFLKWVNPNPPKEISFMETQKPPFAGVPQNRCS